MLGATGTTSLKHWSMIFFRKPVPTFRDHALAGRQGVGDASEFEGRGLLRNFWQGARGFWGEHGTWLSWGLSGALLLIILLNLAAAYGMNVWHRVIFDALQSKEADTVVSLSTLYVPLLAGSVLLSVVQICARMTL